MRRLALTTITSALLAGALVAPARAQLAAGEPATQLTLTNWLAGANNVTDLAFLADGRAVVIRRTGHIMLIGADGSILNPMAAKMEVDNTHDEKGLLGVVRDDAGTLYLYASTGPDALNKHKVYKATVNADNTVTVDLANPIVSQGLEGPANHDGGGLVIHKGQLYIGVGDTGRNATPPVNRYGACLNKANAKILRVNLDGTVPMDNPLVGMAMVTACATPTGDFTMAPPDTRIYAWGFRNPWRLWIDPQTDLLWIGDVGEVTQEEITVGGKGVNHGWPFVEGTMKYAGFGPINDCTALVPSTPCKPPEDSYGRTVGKSITGGLAPRAGCGWGPFEQRYIYGDYATDAIFTLDLKSDRTGATPGSRKPFATIAGPVSFRQGPDGAVYVASYREGSVKRVAPKTIPAACVAAAPAVDGGAAGAGGAGAGGAGAGGAGAAGGAGGAAGAGGAGAGDAGTSPPASSDSSGCGCTLGAPAPAAPALLVLLALLLVFRRLPRRR